jgi:large subunit ribosomal protein L13
MMKTYSVKADDIKRTQHVIDASDEILGRLATRVAGLLMGKHKPIFVRNMDVGDFVVVINASKIRFTGNKGVQKTYYRHSGYPGGLKSITLEKLMATKPERVIEFAVKGMLPRNRLNARMLKRLKVFTGESPAHKVKPVETEKTEKA